RQSDGTRVDLWSSRYVLAVGWGTPVRIDSEDLGDVLSHTSWIDDDGNVAVLWRQSDGSRINLWAARWTSSGWGAAIEIDNEDLGDVSSPVAVVDAAGSVTAAWAQSDGTRTNVWANRFTTAFGWAVATKIESEDLGDAETPKLALQSTAVLAVWRQSDGSRVNLWSNRMVAGAGWGAASEIESEDLGDVDTPELVVDTTDDVTVVWAQSDGVRRNLWTNRYDVGSGWGTAAIIDDRDGTVAEVRLFSDSEDRVTAIWTQSDGTRNDLIASTYEEGSAWDTPEDIESEELGDALLVAAGVVDDLDTLTVVWQQDNGSRRNQWANRRRALSGWETATKIESEDLGDTRRAQLVIDDSGNVTVVWRQDNGTRLDQWANRYVNRFGWDTAEIIDVGDGDVQPRTLVIDSRGRVTAIWPQSNGTNDDLWANRLR
ncbi:MAG: hypothetical protein KDC38_10090, partial [Planctomycetes bacterium]|nr:hypothetical protein [Planctomycetota bacterium]